MMPQNSTSTKGRDWALAGVGLTDPGREPGVKGASVVCAAGPLTGSDWGTVATGSLTAAGVASSKRDWIVPVIRGASSATFQRRSAAAGSRRRPRVTSHAMPRSAVLWIKYV